VCPDALDCCTRQDVCVSLMCLSHAHTHTRVQTYTHDLSSRHTHSCTHTHHTHSCTHTHIHRIVRCDLLEWCTRQDVYISLSLTHTHTHACRHMCTLSLADTRPQAYNTHTPRIVCCDMLDCSTRQDVDLSSTHTHSCIHTHA